MKIKSAFVIGILVSLVLIISVVANAAQEIVVAIEAGSPTALFFKDNIKEFTDKTGIEVSFMEIPHENMHERFLTEAFAETGAIDVYNLDQPWLAEFAAAGFLEPISGKLTEEQKQDFSEIALSTVSYNNQVYGLPYLVHNSLLYYRTDLFEEAGLDQPPIDWEEYRKYAQLLTKDIDNDGEMDVFGTLIEGKQHPEPVTKFLDLLYQAGGQVIDENGKITINSEEALEAFDLMLTIQYEDKTSPPGAPGFDCTDMHILFLQGRLAMAPNWPYMYSMAADPEQSKVVDKFDVAIQPGKVNRGSIVFSWGFGISSASKNKEASWEFIKWATDVNTLERFSKNFTMPVPRKSAMAAILSDIEVTEKQKHVINVMTESVEQSETIPMIPEWQSIVSRLELTVSRVMSLQSTPEEELKNTEEDIIKIMEGQ